MLVLEKLGTLEAERLPSGLEIREKPDPAGFAGRAIGTVAGIAFLAAAGFFWVMPLPGAAAASPVLRLILCGGLAVVGLFLLVSLLAGKSRQRFIVVDETARELGYGEIVEGVRTERGRMAFDDITRLFPGDSGDEGAPRTGTTVLYVKGRNAPRKGILLVGSSTELRDLRQEISERMGRRVL